MSDQRFIPYQPHTISPDEGMKQLRADYQTANQRRSVRNFSSQSVPREMIEEAIRVAGTAPSGAHRQPWRFVCISCNEMKSRIRKAAEIEEKEFYENRATPEWLRALEPLGTDFVKEHITTAPWVIVVFREDYGISDSGARIKNYYMTESVGIAVGFLIQTLHRAGLATLTHTPSPMTFLREICQRPKNEKPFLLLPVGYPAEDCKVPNINRKPLNEISTFFE